MRVLKAATAVVGGLAFVWLVLVRVWAKLHPGTPCPSSLAWLVDNPVRRGLMRVVLDRSGISAGECVLELGPGPGTFTLEAARRVGPEGTVHAIDIQPRMIAALERKLGDAAVANVNAQVGAAYNLPLETASIDRALLIAVLHEVPDQGRALAEVRRVLKPDGILSVTEEFLDPDYPFQRTTLRRVARAGFELAERRGDWRMYTLNFRVNGDLDPLS